MPEEESIGELRDLVLEEISLVDSPANPGAEVVLFKRQSGGESMPKEEKEKPEVTVEGLQADVEGLTAKLAEARESIEALTAEKAALEKRLEPEEPKEDPLEKADPVVKAELAKLRAESEANKAAAEEARELAKDEKEKRERAEFAKVAEERYPSLPGKPEEKGEALRKMAGLGEGDRKVLEAMLKSGEEAMAMQLAERGASGVPLSRGMDAVDARAQELVEKGLAKTKEQAVDLMVRTKDPAIKEAREQ